MSRRAGIYAAIEGQLRTGQFGGEEEALAIRRGEERRRREATEDTREPVAVQRGLFEGDEGCEEE